MALTSQWCENCGKQLTWEHFTDFQVLHNGWRYFCSAYCRSEWQKRRAQQEQQEALLKQQRAMQRQMEAENRRRQQQEAAEKARIEKLGTCAWCGKQNEQVYVDQLLFPGKKFCSKKCLFDCKTAENPNVPADTPYITEQNTGNIFSSFAEAINCGLHDGDILVFSKGTFELDGRIDINTSLTLKAENNAIDAADDEKTIFKLNSFQLGLEPKNMDDKIVLDGLNFINDSNYAIMLNYTRKFDYNKGGNPGECVSIKNCYFTGFKATVFAGDVDSLTVENCKFEKCGRVFWQQGSVAEFITAKDCTFDNVMEVFSECHGSCILDGNELINSNLNQFYYPVATPKTVNERTQAEYDCLQEAIDNAEDGDTLLLEPGIYRKGFAIGNKRNITIKSKSTESKENKHGAIFNISSKYLGGKFGLYGSKTDGIKIEDVFFNFYDSDGASCFQVSSTLSEETVTFTNCTFNNVVKNSFVSSFFVIKKCKFNKNAVRSISAICKSCGDTLFEGKKFCTHCGAKIES